MHLNVPNLRKYKLVNTHVITKNNNIIVECIYEPDESKCKKCLWCNVLMIDKREDAKTCSDVCRKKLSLKRGKISQ